MQNNIDQMKNYLPIIVVLFALMFLASCGTELPDSLNDIEVSKGEKSLKVSVQSLSFEAAGGSDSFSITSNISWNITSDQSWCTVSPSSGSGNGSITVSVSENKTTDSRSATITVKAAELSQTINVTQVGASATLQIDKTNMALVAAGGNDSFTITSNTTWNITSDQSWCTFSTSSGSGNATITVNVLENTSTDMRSATITVKAGDLSQSIAVTQKGVDAILQVDKENMVFDASGGEHSFLITSNTSWTVSSDQSWCTIISSSSGSGNGGVSVYCLENTSTDSRSATITVKAGDLSQTVSIKQAGATPASKRLMFTVNGVSFKMIRVDGGTFTMGATSEQGSDAENNEKPKHSVTLSTYYMGETEVTQELWQAVMGNNPSRFSGSQKPVEWVTWDRCQDFINKLNSLTGQNFRLPTEAEWEFAARGGNNSRGYKYAGSNTIGEVAWYDDNSSTTNNVAQKSPNELGLYDMSGNVYEWCQDWYGSYSSSNQTNPTGPSSGSHRVYRGGCCGVRVKCCRVSFRNYSSPGYLSNNLGLRLAL